MLFVWQYVCYSDVNVYVSILFQLVFCMLFASAFCLFAIVYHWFKICFLSHLIHMSICLSCGYNNVINHPQVISIDSWYVHHSQENGWLMNLLHSHYCCCIHVPRRFIFARYRPNVSDLDLRASGGSELQRSIPSTECLAALSTVLWLYTSQKKKNRFTIWNQR